MGKVAETFVQEFLDALPEGMAKEFTSSNAMFGMAVGEAVEKAMARITPERHVHYHVPEGAVLYADGGTVQISPWVPPKPSAPIEAVVAEPTGIAQDTWPAEGGPLDGQEITTGVGNELYVHDVEDPDRSPGSAYVRHTYRRVKLIEPGFIWRHHAYEGIAGASLATKGR